MGMGLSISVIELMWLSKDSCKESAVERNSAGLKYSLFTACKSTCLYSL